MFVRSSRDKLTLCSKTQWQMFLLVSGRHVAAYPDGHQHGVSMQISIILGKKFPRISRLTEIPALNLGERSLHTFFLFSDSGLHLCSLILVVRKFHVHMIKCA